MAKDLRVIAESDTPPDALIVSISSPALHQAIQSVVESGIPVIGSHSGFDAVKLLGLTGFVGMHDHKAGRIQRRIYGIMDKTRPTNWLIF